MREREREREFWENKKDLALFMTNVKWFYTVRSNSNESLKKGATLTKLHKV